MAHIQNKLEAAFKRGLYALRVQEAGGQRRYGLSVCRSLLGDGGVIVGQSGGGVGNCCLDALLPLR